MSIIQPLPKEVQDWINRKSCDLLHTKKPFTTGELKKDEDGFNIPVIVWQCDQCECKTALHEEI